MSFHSFRCHSIHSDVIPFILMSFHQSKFILTLFHHSGVIPLILISFRHSEVIPFIPLSFHPPPHWEWVVLPPLVHILSSCSHFSHPVVIPSFLHHSGIIPDHSLDPTWPCPKVWRFFVQTEVHPKSSRNDYGMRVFCHSKVIPSQNDLEWPRWGMRSEISFDHHSFQNDPGMTVFCHSDLILSFETKDERNEVDKVPYRDVLITRGREDCTQSRSF